MTPMAASALHERLSIIAGERSYRRLAELTNHNPETVRRYMHGQPPSVEFLASLCASLGVCADWLLTGRGPMRQDQIKAQALERAEPGELLSAVANTLEKVCERVDRIETYVQTLETRLRVGSRPAEFSRPSDQKGRARKKSHGQQSRTDDLAEERSRSVADAISQRPHSDAG